jgi:membrane associated rhomboid family serine protease
MSKDQALKFTPQVIYYPLLFLFFIVFVFWVETRFDLNFNYLGILPRELIGLRGILLGPFIHSDVNHLFNNSIPLFVLGMALFYFYPHIRWKVMLWGLVLTGLLTWIIGRPALHIGASGVIYMLTAFLLFKGIFSKQYQLTALSFAVVFLYGSFLWYVFPIDPKISWEGHLSGLVVGFLFSILFRTDHLENRKYAWEHEDYNPEEDAFLKHFDDEGNFIEHKEETFEEANDTPAVRIRYTIKKDSKKD